MAFFIVCYMRSSTGVGALLKLERAFRLGAVYISCSRSAPVASFTSAPEIYK